MKSPVGLFWGYGESGCLEGQWDSDMYTRGILTPHG